MRSGRRRAASAGTGGGIHAAIFAIDEAEASGTGAPASAPAVVVRPVLLWRRLAIYAASALIAGAAIVGGAVWLSIGAEPPRVSRLVITTTPATALTINGVDRALAITPDGSRIVCVGSGRELFVRSLDALEPVRLFTGAPHGPFVSPDGQWVGFVDVTDVMKRVAILGGPPVTIAALDGIPPGRHLDAGPHDRVCDHGHHRYLDHDGTNKAVGRNFILADGKRLFLGGSAPGRDPVIK
jgi:hypothetical protein